MSNKLVVSDYDFDAIKLNLKSFLQGQTSFQDYDFEGSSLNILLDILSYNTHYLAYLANMSTNELYLDSADIRNNIVSLAKMIGYTPSSPRAPMASIDVTLNNATGTSVTMSKGTVFTTTVENTSYQYVTNSDITITPSSGIYKFSNVSVYEGSLVTFKYTVDSTDVDQKFTIPNANADTSTLLVKIQNSSTDTTTNTYSLAGGYNSVDATSKVYFIQESQDGKYEVSYLPKMAQISPVNDIQHLDYDNDSNKSDFNLYTKANYGLNEKWSLFGDLQYRRVGYSANGEDTGLVDDTFRFFNPKAGIVFDLNRNNNFYLSYAVANREPNRNDYESGNPKPERLNDFELGWRYVSPKFQLNANTYYMRYKDQLVLTG